MKNYDAEIGLVLAAALIVLLVFLGVVSTDDSSDGCVGTTELEP